MEHNNAKIEEIIQKIPNEMPFHEFTVEAMKEYAPYIREQTIQECLGCVPPIAEECTFSGLKMNESGNRRWNDCREQTIIKINNLSK